jgi:hypothetical protein
VLDEQRQILGDGLPNDGGLTVELAVDQLVPHSGRPTPGHGRMATANLGRDLFGGLADQFQGADDRRRLHVLARPGAPLAGRGSAPR